MEVLFLLSFLSSNSHYLNRTSIKAIIRHLEVSKNGTPSDDLVIPRYKARLIVDFGPWFTGQRCFVVVMMHVGLIICNTMVFLIISDYLYIIHVSFTISYYFTANSHWNGLNKHINHLKASIHTCHTLPFASICYIHCHFSVPRCVKPMRFCRFRWVPRAQCYTWPSWLLPHRHPSQGRPGLATAKCRKTMWDGTESSTKYVNIWLVV